MKRTAIALLMSIVLAGAFSGCGGTSSDAQPTSTTPPAPPLWDPCSIPDDAIRAAGLRTETKSNDYIGILPEGWKICKWEAVAGWYRLTIFSSPKSLAETRNSSQIREVSAVRIGNQEGIQYRHQNDAEGCDVALGYGARTIVTAVVTGGNARPNESCTEARATATRLEKHYR